MGLTLQPALSPEPKHLRPRLTSRTLVAILVPFGAIAMEWLLLPLLYPRVLITLLVGPLLSAWLLGLPGGLWATAVCATGGWWLFMRPELALGAPVAGQLISMAAFATVGTIIALLFENQRRQAQRARALFEHSADGIFVADAEGNYREVNDAGCRMLGFTRDEILSMNVRDLISAADLARQAETIALLASGGNQMAEWSLRRKDGTFITAELNVNALPGGRIQAFVRDLTARRHADEQLRLASVAFDHTNDAVMIAAADGRLLSVNRAFTKITGFPASEALGRNPRFLQSGLHTPAFYEALWETLIRDGTWSGEIWNRRKDGQLYPAWENLSVVRGGDGAITHFVGIEADISTLKRAEADLEHLAHHDALTGLPNRRFITDSLDLAIQRATRHDYLLALLFIDFDRFKLINDTLGHDAGDAFLQTVAQRVRTAVRAEDLVGRLGGDEFVVLIEAPAHADDAGGVAAKVLAALHQPLQIAGREIIPPCSIGVSMFPADGVTARELLRAADAAMYRAKQRGNRYEFYAPETNRRWLDRLALEQGVRRALDRDELRLYYQPQFDLASGGITGAETLLRWQHPDQGLLLPDQFIPIAEETSLMTEIGAWVIRHALIDVQGWTRGGYRPPQLAINVSGRELAHETLLAALDEGCRSSRLVLEDTSLEIEVTESVLASVKTSAAVLATLRQRGVRVAIDDFGTGYASLSRLRDLPVDTLKLDYSFIKGIPADPFSNAIASGVISMADALDLRMVAEGVETDAQAAFLRERGCQDAQGYLFGAPMTATALSALLPAA